MAVPVQAQLPHRPDLLEHPLDAVQQCIGGAQVGLFDRLGQQTAVEYMLAGLHTEPFDAEPLPGAKRTHGTNTMQARKAPAEHRTGVGRIKLRGTAAHPREHGEAEVLKSEQGGAVHRNGGGHGHLGGGELGRKRVLLANLRIGPPRRTVELEHERTLGPPHLVHPVLVAVEREEPSVPLETETCRGIEHRVGRQACERFHGAVGTFVYHRRQTSQKEQYE